MGPQHFYFLFIFFTSNSHISVAVVFGINFGLFYSDSNFLKATQTHGVKYGDGGK